MVQPVNMIMLFMQWLGAYWHQVIDLNNSVLAGVLLQVLWASTKYIPCLYVAAGIRMWHKLDSRFAQPRVHAYFRISSSHGYTSPRAAALTHLYLKLVEDALNEDAYLADVAGLHYGLSPEGLAGVEVRLDGFSHKLSLLAERIFRALATAKVITGLLSEH